MKLSRWQFAVHPLTPPGVMSLDAFFVGIIQVLVYAGAVMVLFLFIIMALYIVRALPL